MSVGKRLKEWRLENNLKTTDIHKKTGISTGGFSDYENDIKLIGSKTLITLSQNYEIDITYILTGVRKTTELNKRQKELIKYFDRLPEQEQNRELGRLEAKAEQYQEQEKLSSSRTG